MDTTTPWDTRSLPRRPRWRPEAFVLPQSGPALHVGLGDRTMAVLAPADASVAGWLESLDGGRALDAVVEQAPQGLGAPGDVLRMIEGLDRLGLINDAGAGLGTTSRPGPSLGAVHLELSLGRGSSAAAAVMAARSRAVVRIHGAGRVPRDTAEALRDSGVGGVEQGPAEPGPGATTIDLCVVIGQPGLGTRWDRANEQPMRARQPHLAVEIGPTDVRLTPVLKPGRTACLHCRHLRRRDAEPDFPALVDRWRCRLPADLSPVANHVATAAVATAALECLDQVLLSAPGRHALAARWTAVRLSDGRTVSTDPLAHPACPYGCQQHLDSEGPARDG